MLFDGIEEQPQGCKIARFDLDEEDREALGRHLAGRKISLPVIQRHLAAGGFEVSVNLLSRHRSGQCACSQ